jgi:hypothetical protein
VNWNAPRNLRKILRFRSPSFPITGWGKVVSIFRKKLEAAVGTQAARESVIR